jgi:Kelch motif
MLGGVLRSWPTAGVLASVLACGCGSHHRDPVSSRSPAPPAATAHPAQTRPQRLRVVAIRPLPAPVQLPALALRGPTVLALGGLDAADASVASITHVLPAPAHPAGKLPQPVHDAGAAALGSHVYVFGGGTAAGPLDSIVEVGSGIVGHLPAPASDLEAVPVDGAILIVGGYTGVQPLRSVLSYTPRRRIERVAELPHALRYAAAAAAPGGVLLVAGGNDGVHARDEIVRVDPKRRRATVIGRLPVALSHVAGAVLGHTLYVFGGRTDAGVARRTIWAIDTRSGSVKSAGRLPAALSDAAAITMGDRIVLVGGRTAAGRVSDRAVELALRR